MRHAFKVAIISSVVCFWSYVAALVWGQVMNEFVDEVSAGVALCIVGVFLLSLATAFVSTTVGLVQKVMES